MLLVVQERSFDNFESILLSYKTLFKMTGNLGRVRRHSILMVTGNRNGSVGFTLTEGKYGKGMKNMRAAVNKAGLRLINIDRFEEENIIGTVIHQVIDLPSTVSFGTKLKKFVNTTSCVQLTVIC